MFKDEFIKRKKPKDEGERTKFVQKIKAKLNELQQTFTSRSDKLEQTVKNVEGLHHDLFNIKTEIGKLEVWLREIMDIDYSLPEPTRVQEVIISTTGTTDQVKPPVKSDEEQLKEELDQKGITIQELLEELRKKPE